MNRQVSSNSNVQVLLKPALFSNLDSRNIANIEGNSAVVRAVL